MKILVICQYYAPEPFRHPDICEDLVARGHEVTVITGMPNYPMGEIYEGFRHGERRNEAINGVKIHRCFTIGRKGGVLKRFLNYYSYVFSSCQYVSQLHDNFDVVLVNQLSPVMMAYAGIKYKKKYHRKLVLYCLDLWPESLIAGGIHHDSLPYRLFHHISRRIYKQADRILITSRQFADYFRQEFHITDTKYLPQYAEDLFVPAACAKKADEYLDLMFAGNTGVAQSVETVIRAAELTSDMKNVRWHIVGDGSELHKLQKMASDLKQVCFHGRRSVTEMPAFYAKADAMLVTMQKDPFLSMTLPGKVQSCMAAGKPLICAADGETPAVITEAECGLCGPAEDAKALADNVRRFSQLKSNEMGNNARMYYEKHFSRKSFMDELETELLQCI